jgi:1-acyl-sn-glycerol-3-phosphate acyltransferase
MIPRFLQFRRRSNFYGGWSLLMWWTIVPEFTKLVFLVLYRLRYRGVRALPPTGPVLVLSNHQSLYDPMLVSSVLRDRAPRSLAKRSLIDGNGVLGWLIRCAFGSIPIEQGQDDTAAIRAMINELKQDRVAVIYPEGGRFTDGVVHPFQRGAWVLIKRGHAPVLPVAIAGTGAIWPPGQSKPRLRGRMGMAIGKPIERQTLLDMGEEAALLMLHDEVARLAKEACWWA